jgi:signal transduction histidine kinase
MKPSIERTLLAWLLGVLSLGSVLVALVTYLSTLEEMNEFFDANLKAVAETVGRRDAARTPTPGAAAAPATPVLPGASTGEYEIVAMAWTLQGERTFASHTGIDLPFTTVEGQSHVRIGGEEWVVHTSVGEQGVAQAAQSLVARRYMARESAGEVLAPLLVLVLAVVGLLVFGLRRGLKPLDAAAADIAARSAATLAPIAAADVPREMAPLVASINGLMARLDSAMGAQRRFLADAAHELRTPLTALRLQQQLLARSTDEASRHEALARMEQGIDRAQRLLEQLLQISRAEPDGEALRLQTVDLAALAKETVAAFAPRAEHIGVDLGATTVPGLAVRGDLHQLRVLLNNLVDNALRHTPAGGVVDVGTAEREGRAALFVVDSGPGIAEAERERVFDRFFRGAEARDGTGSGLGLAIVKAIATRHAAQVRLATPASGRGLRIEVIFDPGLGPG